MKRVFIIHGYTGYPDKNWFPWLKAELEQLGVHVEVPSMPNTDNPVLDEWLPHLQELIKNPDDETYFVGHSLGCPAILRYLEIVQGSQFGGALLVAGFAEPITLTQLNSFVAGPWDDEHITKAVKNITLINSDDDPYVPLAAGERMRDRFNAKLVVMHKAGHISARTGHLRVPEILTELREIMNL